MRSRFSAFALGLGEYLAKTLATTHPDRALPRRDLVAEHSLARKHQRFAGLRILHASSDEQHGEVLFLARIYLRGADQSFAELSQFVCESGAWRYAEGQLLDKAKLPANAATLTRAEFLSLCSATSAPSPS